MCIDACTRNKHESEWESCVTVRYKTKFGVYSSNGFEVYQLWHACVVMTCVDDLQQVYCSDVQNKMGCTVVTDLKYINCGMHT